MKHCRPALLLCTLIVASTIAVPGAGPDDNWPQWRGPAGTGISEGNSYPDEWAPDKNVAWKTPVPGRGLSSPVVWGNRVFLTTSIDGQPAPPDHKPPIHPDFNNKDGYLHPDSVGSNFLHTLKVMAFDTKTGRQLWEQTAYDGPMYDDRHRKNTYASPTIATDGKLVYAFFESAGIYAYDFDGKLVWKKSLGGIAKAGLGPGTSPVIFEDLLILLCDQEMGKGSFIAALNKADGKEVWRADRSSRRSWATPLLVRTPERAELVTSAAERVISYDPRTGKELWRANGVQSHPIPSAVTTKGIVFLSAGSSSKNALAVKPGSGELLWTYNKGAAYVPSPIALGNYFYMVNDAGLMTCIDAVTGERIYEGGRPPVPATFTASPIAFDDKILLTSEDGDTFVVKAGPVHEVLRTNSVGEPVYASPAIADGTIYIRGERHLFAIRRP